MSDFQKRRVLGLAGLVFGVAVILPVVFGLPRGISGQGGDGWRNFIFDFQTLITGIAAVFAAGYTVRQMIRSDEKQDRRHKEAMAFAMRGETRRMDRGLHPQLKHLREAALKLDAVWFEPEDINGKPYNQYRWFSEIIFPLKPIVNEILAILERSTIRDAADIFDGDLLLVYEQTVRDATNIKSWFARHIEANDFDESGDASLNYFYDNVEWEEEGFYRVAITIAFHIRLDQLIHEMEKAAIGLVRLKSRFDVE
ncbi:hypothetical protein ACQZ46_11590 [Agrobacterium salinitolerans]